MLCSKPCLLTPTPFRSAASAERDGVSVEDVGPALLRTERHQVALRTFPMARKATMLELHPGALRPLLMKAQLDLAGLFGVRHRLAPGADLPGERQPMRRVPYEHPSPVDPESIRPALEATSTLATLDADGLQHILGPGVLAGVPRGEFFSAKTA